MFIGRIKIYTFLLSFFCIACLQLRGQVNANFSASPTSGCSPITVVFQDLSTGSPTSWKWDLGNGTISTLQNPATTYFTPGSYTIKLTAYNGTDSSVSIKTNYVVVNAVPTVAFAANPISGCSPLTVAFTDQSISGSGTIVSWQWDFGDGNISNLQNPTHIYTNTGQFNVTLTITNSIGCHKTLNKPNLISINSGLQSNFSNSSPPPCVVPATIQFTNLATGTGINGFLWNFGDGQTSNQPNPSHTYSSAGNFTVSLTVSNSNGCTDVLVKPSLIYIGVANVGFNMPANVCEGVPFQITNTSNPLSSLISSLWTFSDGTTSNVTNPIKTFNTAGTYSVSLSGNFGACQNTITQNITVLPKPVASFTGTNTSACKPPLTTSFTNTSSGGGNVVIWYFGDGTSSTAANPVHTYNSLGNFNVKLVVKNANGCVDSITIAPFVTIAPPKIIKINGAPKEGCIPYTANFVPVIQSIDPIVSYQWNFGDGNTSNQQNPSHLYAVEGSYNLTLIVITASGCADTFKLSPGIKVGQKPSAAFFANPLISCPMENVNFTSQASGGADSYLWFFGDGGTSTNANPTYQYNDTGYFNVTFIAIRNGCRDTAYRPKYIYIKPPIASFVDSFSCSNQKSHFFIDHSVGAQFYSWHFGDGSDSVTTPNASHMYADTGRYTVTLAVRDSSCHHMATKTILVLNEHAGFNAIDSLGCRSSVKQFFATANPYNIGNFYWDFGDGTSYNDSFAVHISHNYSTVGIFNVKQKITDLNNCPDSTTKPVSVSIYGPKANFGALQKICVNTAATFSDSSHSDSVNNIVKWIFDFGDTTTQSFTSAPFSHIYTKGGIYSVSLIVEDAFGCRDTIVKQNIVEVRDPKANFYSADTIHCQSSPIQFINQSSANLISFTWDLGDSTISNDVNPNHLYNYQGTYDIKLVVADDIGCKDSIFRPKYIRIYNAKAIFNMSDSFTTCPPLLVLFTNQSININQLTWDFGDGNTSTLLNPSHTYTQSGIFNVRLSVLGNGACTDTTIKQVKILGPAGTFTYGPLKGCTPVMVHFKSNAINTKFYTWDFNDGVASYGTDTAINHSYSLLGSYLPKIILEDSLGCKLPIFGTDTIKIKGISTHIKSLTNYLFCDSSFVHFTDSTNTNDTIQSYQWNFGDGQTSNLQSPVHMYSIQGIYKVSLTVTTITGCISSDTLNIPIKVVAVPQINILGPDSLCVPGVVQFTSQWLNPDTSTMHWHWDFGNGQISNSQTPGPAIYFLPGHYNITSIGTNGSGCADTIIHPIDVYPPPVVNAGPDKLICFGQTQPLLATGALKYVWATDTSLSCTVCANPIAKPLSTRLYSVIGTDIHGCKASDSVIIKVQQPFPMIVSPNDTLCIGKSSQLNAQGADSYLWTPPTFLNNPIIANPISKPDTSIKYMVVGTDSYNCFHDTGYVSIKVYPIPTINIIEDRITVVVGNTVQIHSNASSDVTHWLWSPTTGLNCPICPNPNSTPRQDITYTLTASNDGHCQAQDQVVLIVVCNDGNMFVPNTFSPNNDGVNDVFYPRGKGLYAIKNFKVFNRWGEMVFSNANFQPNDATAGWDGTYKGQKLTPDVYVYIMDIICNNNQVFSLKGNVTLIR